MFKTIAVCGSRRVWQFEWSWNKVMVGEPAVGVIII